MTTQSERHVPCSANKMVTPLSHCGPVVSEGAEQEALRPSITRSAARFGMDMPAWLISTRN